MLKSEINKYKNVIDRMGVELKESRSVVQPPKESTKSTDDVYKTDRIERMLKSTGTKLENISRAITDIINGEISIESIRNAIISHGDLYHQVLNLVISKRSLKVSDIAAMLNVSDIDITPILDKLSVSGDIEIRDGLTVILSDKYEIDKISIDDWNNMIYLHQ